MVELRGIIRGVYSEMGGEVPAVHTLQYPNLEGLIGLILPEWIYTLRINGKKVMNPEKYLQEKGIWNQLIRRSDD